MNIIDVFAGLFSGRTATEVDLYEFKPSDLILVALNDLLSCIEDDRYEVSMLDWHTASSYDNASCMVCLAGAVMAQTLKSNPKCDFIPSSFDQKTGRALLALNEFRVGHVSTGFGHLGLKEATGLKFNREIAHWYHNELQFQRDMFKLSDHLAAAGY